MKQEITKSSFRDAFRDYGRQDQFSYNGLGALYDWLEQLYDECYENDYELDVIALCCEFTEYENLKDFQSNYGDDYKTMEDIEQETSVIMIDSDSFIIQDF